MTSRYAWGAALVAVVVTAALAWGFVHRDLPWEFTSGDEAEYAELARRLASGRGFTTGIIYPIEVEWGVHDAHPSLLRAPLWPLILAGVFKLTGPAEAPVLVATLVCHMGAALLAALLAASLADRWTGLAAGLAVATCPDVIVFAEIGASETLFAMWTALFFLLAARRVDGLWLGVVCGLAYLTRYNGGLMVVVAGLLVARATGAWAWGPIIRCGVGFAAVAAPWWVRNLIVTGSPTYSLYGVTLYFSPELLPPNGSLIYMLDPDLTSVAAMAPLEKLVELLPQAIAHWPLASANLLAFGGLILACVRRQRLALALFGLASVTTVLISTMALRGRYLVPFVPAAIALGLAAWSRYGGRLARPALIAAVLVPLLPLPRFPTPLYDIQLAHGAFEQMRERVRAGEAPDDRAERFARCLGERPLVIAQNGAAVNWAADTVTLHMTRTDEDFWALVDAHPVEYVRLRDGHRLHSDARFLASFDPAVRCGPGVYRRRSSDPL
jgi:4-amino-4-deoxy-L-arabinose transferase-like glycosyltransferase